MPTIAEETGQSVESVDAKDNGQQNNKEVSGSTEASPIKMAVINENQQDELVQILTKGANGSNPQKQFVNQFVHPNQRVRTREEIENEVIAELREIDR